MQLDSVFKFREKTKRRVRYLAVDFCLISFNKKKEHDLKNELEKQSGCSTTRNFHSSSFDQIACKCVVNVLKWKGVMISGGCNLVLSI